MHSANPYEPLGNKHGLEPRSSSQLARPQKCRRHLQNGSPSGTHPERTLGTYLAVKRGLCINPRGAIDALYAFVTIKLGVLSTI